MSKRGYRPAPPVQPHGPRVVFPEDGFMGVPYVFGGHDLNIAEVIDVAVTRSHAASVGQENRFRPYLNLHASGLPLRAELEPAAFAFSSLVQHGARLNSDDLERFEQIVAKLTRKEVEVLAGDDAWLANFALNVWEYMTGADRLTTYPWNISLPIADICNARCNFCTSWFEGKALVKLKQIESFAEVISRAVYIGLVGHGEPMAHPQFDKICEIIERHKDKRATAYTITNGVFLKKWADLLERINVGSVSISLNAATAATHHEVMGLGEDALPGILEGIRILTDRVNEREEGTVSITMVVTQQNFHEIPEFIALGEDLGVTQVWLRSLLPQTQLIAGLNYHTLPPNLHPEFEHHKKRALEAIALAKVLVQADPAMWEQQVFSPKLAAEIKANPPAMVTREEVLRSRERRDHVREFYSADGAGLMGDPLPRDAHTKSSFVGPLMRIETRALPWAFSAEFAILPPEEISGRGKVELPVSGVRGMVGFGLLDTASNEFVAREFVTGAAARKVVLEFDAPRTGLKLIVQNGDTPPDAPRGSICTIGAPRVTVIGAAGAWSEEIPVTRGQIHAPIDPFEDGLNDYGRQPRYFCKAPYYNLYVNEMFYRLSPCCFLTGTPGHQEIRFDGSRPFMDAWNAPAMVELRRSLRDGPLYAACRKCPEKW